MMDHDPRCRSCLLRSVAAELLTYAASTPMPCSLPGEQWYARGREDGRADAAEYVRRLARECLR